MVKLSFDRRSTSLHGDMMWGWDRGHPYRRVPCPLHPLQDNFKNVPSRPLRPLTGASALVTRVSRNLDNTFLLEAVTQPLPLLFPGLRRRPASKSSLHLMASLQFAIGMEAASLSKSIVRRISDASCSALSNTGLMLAGSITHDVMGFPRAFVPSSTSTSLKPPARANFQVPLLGHGYVDRASGPVVTPHFDFCIHSAFEEAAPPRPFGAASAAETQALVAEHPPPL